MLRYLVDPIFQVINTAGKPATGGFIEVYLHGTRDKYYCASDFDGTLHPFRIPLDSLGSNIILADDANAYDIYVYNRYGSLLMSRYNVTPSSIDDIAASLALKKNKQQAKSFNGSATKTVKEVAQNENGEVTVEYVDIDLPEEIPNVDIVSPNNTITVSSSTNPQTNTKTFEIDVANGGNSCGWFNSSNIDTEGNEESINVDRFRISEGQTVIGNGLEFVPIEGDVESGVQFGNVYAKAGIYFVSARLILLWSGNPVNKVCNVGGRQFDFSYNHEEKVIATNLKRFSSRTKMSVNISLESDIPAGLRIWVDRFQIFAINAGTLKIQGIEAVEHDGTLTGNGTAANPLSIQSALDVSNANIALEYDPEATYPTVGTLIMQDGVLYRSKVAITTNEEWTPSHWEESTISKELQSDWIDLPTSWWIGPNTRYFYLKANIKSKIIYIDIALEQDALTPESIAPGAQIILGPFLKIPSEVQAMHAVGISMFYKNNSLDLISSGFWFFSVSESKLKVQLVNTYSSYITVSSVAISGIIPYAGEI